ncbi:hypothetical protein SO694_0003327 [Aureococcus anophagefferens]|uniref:Uncharacterized protein n=1 Tax=Aureococcus anophagefferens TaxID=44056 RepID=A0ABR1FK73_AURAN
MVAAVAEEEDHGAPRAPAPTRASATTTSASPKMQHRLTAGLNKVALAAYKAELADLAIDGFPYCAAEAARDQAREGLAHDAPGGLRGLHERRVRRGRRDLASASRARA